MRATRWLQAGLWSVVLVAALAWIAPPSALDAQGTQYPLTFFVTSVGKGDGGNLSGVAGADAHCQRLAGSVGRRKNTWHAYLSTQGPNAVNARDRIGSGPWYNALGQLIARNPDELHSNMAAWTTLATKDGSPLSINEKGETVPGEGKDDNRHDVMTGSTPEGRAFNDGADHSCNSWTSNATGAAQIGHADLQDGNSGGKPTSSWNSAHPSREGCSQAGLEKTKMGAGLFYCFAID